MTKEFVCIVCPSSCRLTVSEENGTCVVKGNGCKRGIDHGIKEYSEPERMLTTTVAIQNAQLPRVPVVSKGEIPKAKLYDCLEELYKLVLNAPVLCGDIVAKNICGTGVDICASRSMNRKGE